MYTATIHQNPLILSFHDLVPGRLERSRTQCGPQSPGGATGDGEVTHCSWDMSTSYDWDRKNIY